MTVIAAVTSSTYSRLRYPFAGRLPARPYHLYVAEQSLLLGPRHGVDQQHGHSRGGVCQGLRQQLGRYHQRQKDQDDEEVLERPR